jgi:uncharacterized damage-inducible protein DinB
MDLVAQYAALARYNRWMNERVYAAAATLTDEERRRDQGAFWKSIHGTLSHLLLGDRAWLARFTGDPSVASAEDAAGRTVRIRSLDQELYADFATLRRERARTDDAIAGWVADLTAERLAAPLHYHSTDGREWEHPLWWAVTHFFNHQTHHRGQVTALLTRLGHDPGDTDLVLMLRRGEGRA